LLSDADRGGQRVVRDPHDVALATAVVEELSDALAQIALGVRDAERPLVVR
jgi:hypothetical protein